MENKLRRSYRGRKKPKKCGYESNNVIYVNYSSDNTPNTYNEVVKTVNESNENETWRI